MSRDPNGVSTIVAPAAVTVAWVTGSGRRASLRNGTMRIAVRTTESSLSVGAITVTSVVPAPSRCPISSPFSSGVSSAAMRRA